jgi:hypothetical protein
VDDLDRDNLLVLGPFAASLLVLIGAYLIAWRSKRTASRRLGSLVIALVAALAGLFILMWLIGAVMPLPPPDGSSIWGPVLVLLVFSPLPLGAFYICAKFIRRAYPDGGAPAKATTGEPDHGKRH